MTDTELEQKIVDLRKLLKGQEHSIANRLGSGESVPTSDINGLAQLVVRIDSLERILEHRRTRSAPARRQTRRAQNRTST